jgi:hypothetical protein
MTEMMTGRKRDGSGTEAGGTDGNERRRETDGGVDDGTGHARTAA